MSEKPQDESIGALWERKSQKGEPYMTGEINGVKVVCFRNRLKSGKQPDWRVKLSQPKPESEPAPHEDEDAPF